MDIMRILVRHFPGAQWTLNGEDYSGLVWIDNSQKPTEAELVALWPGVLAEITADAAAQTASRNAILTTAQTAVGVKLTDLTAAQIKALMACLLYAAGGVDAKTMAVKPLSEWMK